MTDIFKIHESLVEEYKRFSTIFTSIRAPDIRQVVEVARERGDYWPEPLVQLNAKNRRAESVQSLAARGILESACGETRASCHENQGGMGSSGLYCERVLFGIGPFCSRTSPK